MRDATVMFVGVICSIVGVWLGKSTDKHAPMIVDLLMCMAVFAVWALALYLSLLYAIAYDKYVFPVYVVVGCFFGCVVGAVEGYWVVGGYSTSTFTSISFSPSPSPGVGERILLPAVVRLCIEMAIGALVCLWLWGTLGVIVSAATKALRELHSRKRRLAMQDQVPRDNAARASASASGSGTSTDRRDLPLRRRSSATFLHKYPYITLHPLPQSRIGRGEEQTGGEQTQEETRRSN